MVVAQPAHAKSSIMSLSEIALASAAEKRASGGGGWNLLDSGCLLKRKILHRPNRVLMKRSRFLATPRAPAAGCILALSISLIGSSPRRARRREVHRSSHLRPRPVAYTTTVEPFARALADWLKIGALWRGADETASHCRTTRRLTVSFFVSLAFSSYYPGLYESLHVSQARSMPLARSRFLKVPECGRK